MFVFAVYAWAISPAFGLFSVCVFFFLPVFFVFLFLRPPATFPPTRKRNDAGLNQVNASHGTTQFAMGGLDSGEKK